MSRFDDIVKAIIDGDEYKENPYSRNEYWLLQIKEAIENGGGGGGGTNNYNALINQPMVNNNVLKGDKSFEDLGLKPITKAQIDALFNKQ